MTRTSLWSYGPGSITASLWYIKRQISLVTRICSLRCLLAINMPFCFPHGDSVHSVRLPVRSPLSFYVDHNAIASENMIYCMNMLPACITVTNRSYQPSWNAPFRPHKKEKFKNEKTQTVDHLQKFQQKTSLPLALQKAHRVNCCYALGKHETWTHPFPHSLFRRVGLLQFIKTYWPFLGTTKLAGMGRLTLKM